MPVVEPKTFICSYVPEPGAGCPQVVGSRFTLRRRFAIARQMLQIAWRPINGLGNCEIDGRCSALASLLDVEADLLAVIKGAEARLLDG
jgi:hypothetical protein